MWDLIIIVCYLILLAVYLFLYSRILTQPNSSNEKNRVFQKAVHICAYIALPVAIMVHSITAWIFGLQISRSYWYTALLAPSFIASALVSGLALLILSALLARKTKIIGFSNDLIEWLGGLLAVFISVDFFFLLSELLTRLYPGAEGESSPALLLVVGRYAPLFWIEVVAGLVLPFLLLVNKGLRNRTAVIGWASALAILGIFLKRFNLLMAGYAYPYSNLATNVRVGQFLPNEEQSVWTSNVGSLVQSWPYSPTWVEAAIVLGLVAAGILVWLFGIQLISMQVEKNK
jgi:molybdopterin-containing oxidoreductase family membrane subunit